MGQETNTMYTFLVGGSISSLTYLVGGFDNLILALAIFMITDFILGCMVGAKRGYEQSQREKKSGIKEEEVEGLNSHRAFLGLMKKTAMLLGVIIAVQLDSVAGNDSAFMRNAMIMFLLGVEGLSFVENMGHLGLKVPTFLTNVFAQLKNENDRKD